MSRESNSAPFPLPRPGVRAAQPLTLPTPWMVRDSDRDVLSEIALSLWYDPEKARARGCNALAMASLSAELPEVMVERAAALLLNECEREGDGGQQGAKTGPQGPFWRLPAKARLALAVLHGDMRWSWRRTARVFGWAAAFESGRNPTAESMKEISSELLDLVSRLAWSARLELGWEIGAGYPAGSSTPQDGTRFCPEHDPRAPWTQRFLDEELQPRERLFLQNHLMTCKSCRSSLDMARKLFYSVDVLIRRLIEEPRGKSAPAGGNARAEISKAFSLLLAGRKAALRPVSLGFAESIRYHLSKRENQIVWLLGAAAILISAWFL